MGRAHGVGAFTAGAEHVLRPLDEEAWGIPGARADLEGRQREHRQGRNFLMRLFECCEEPHNTHNNVTDIHKLIFPI